ncbi:MAG: glycosyl transferase family 2 [Verrucomicrobiaceae bacterium]|nr:glycosyl transferase family 2 [Verrucomicrobiaceae bacterium]
MKLLVPVSAVLPTRNRPALLARFLQSLAAQTVTPAEIVICDASEDGATESVVSTARLSWSDTRVQWIYQRAERTGLAPQRNQAVATASQTFVWFLDDDVILEPACLEVLYKVASSDEHIGGVTATITNQHYSPPGPFVRGLMRWFEHGRERSTYASACIGPGWAFYPDASPDIPETTPAEWMIGCCTLYRKAVLPCPAVPDHFESGAIGEDLAASLHVARHSITLHARDARCLHDSQGGDHKRSAVRLADQGLRNRFHIMTHVMGKDSLRDRFDFALMLAFNVASQLRRPAQWGQAARVFAGYITGTFRLLRNHRHG